MTIASGITHLIGNTPVVELRSFGGTDRAKIFAKLESFNPGGSVKDRIALAMVEDAEARGLLRPGGTIVEPTSGNTGIGLAMVAAAKGYRLVVVMPESMSLERRKILAAYGAELVLTPGELGMRGSVEKAREILERNPDYFMPCQFDNPANPACHERTTAREILGAFPHLDAFVCGIGTGGTITGVGRVLKRERPGTLVVGVEPAESPVFSGGQPGTHYIEGIGPGFIPSVFDRSVVDRVIPVTSEEAFEATRQLARSEGIFVGISSGAAAAAAVTVARELGRGKSVVVLFPDRGERYLSVKKLL